ncbi:hypothetical protein PoHVEF18_003479 [Penicillium ochrochloron]
MADVRVPNAGDQPTKSPTSTLLLPEAGIELTNQLSYLLDKERNESLEYELAIPITTTPSYIVATMPSTKPVIISKSALPVLHQNQQIIPMVGYRRIGFGQCGIICERPGRAYVVNLARSAYKKGLWADFQAHFIVREAFKQDYNPECHVHKLFSWIPESNTDWWDKNQIVSLGRRLGSRRQQPKLLSPNFTLRNYNLHLDQMLELGLPVLLFASTMGEALANIHWAAHVDGYDIEFELGSERDKCTGDSEDIAVSSN